MTVALRAALMVLPLFAQTAPKTLVKPAPVEVQMRNVNLHFDQSIMLEIRRLRGQYLPTGSQSASFDDLNSFVTRIDSAEIAMSARSMSDLLNRYVFNYPGTPLKNIVVTIENGRIKQKGTLHKGIDVPFEIDGSLSVTPDGGLMLHADKVRSAHLPFKGLMHLFGEDLAKLVNIKKDNGVTLDGDNILLSPERMIPPPRIQGKVTAVRIEGDRIIQTFGGKETKPLVPIYRAKNYIYQKGGVLRFGKLTMTDTDLEIVDQSTKTPFEFSLREYSRQLVAGYSKNTPNRGLIVFMPDLNTLRNRGKSHP
jgi:hypothetical protein